MSLSPLSRFAAPLAIVAGALVIVTRLVIMLTTPTEIEPLTAYVLTTTHAVNSILSIVAFALLAVAVVAVYDLEARKAGGWAPSGLPRRSSAPCSWPGTGGTRPSRSRGSRKSLLRRSRRSSAAGCLPVVC